MAKVAVLIAGQFREFEIAVKSWKFLELPHEFYIGMATWSSTYETSYNTPGQFNIEEVTEDRIRNALPKINDCQIFGEFGTSSPQKLLFQINACLNTLREKTSISDFDAVIIIRPDIWIDGIDFKKLLKPGFIKEDVIYGYGVPHIDGAGNMAVTDCFFCGTPRTIEKFASIKIPDNYKYGFESVVGKFYHDAGITPLLVPGKFTTLVVRSNSRTLKKHTTKAIQEKTKEWWNKNHPENKWI